MVNMVGFHHKEPVFNTAAYGEAGHYFRFRAIPSDEFPLRGKVTFPCGYATFRSPEDAHEFLGHPGDVKHAARYYLEQVVAPSDTLFDFGGLTT